MRACRFPWSRISAKGQPNTQKMAEMVCFRTVSVPQQSCVTVWVMPRRANERRNHGHSINHHGHQQLPSGDGGRTRSGNAQAHRGTRRTRTGLPPVLSQSGASGERRRVSSVGCRRRGIPRRVQQCGIRGPLPSARGRGAVQASLNAQHPHPLPAREHPALCGRYPFHHARRA